MLVQIVLFDGFDLLDAVAPYEVLLAGSMATHAFTVEFASAEGARAVPSGAGGITLQATSRLDPTHAQLIVVPGAVGTNEELPGLLAAAAQTELAPLVARALSTSGVTVATVWRAA